jgi:DNA-binding IclR family transcriptional regulator
MSVTDKVLALLAAFTYESPTLTLTELARRTGLPLPTVHRRAAELVRWGALERGPDRRYRIGLRLWEVASLAPRGALRNVALPIMQELYDVTREHHVHLALRDDMDVVFLERLSSPSGPLADSRVGGRFGAFATGAGLVLLAHAPSDVQETYLQTALRRYTENTVTDPAHLRSILANIRRDGYSVSDRMVGMDVQCIGAPILGAEGSTVAAVSICFRAGTQSPQTQALVVRAAARRISSALQGASPQGS